MRTNRAAHAQRNTHTTCATMWERINLSTPPESTEERACHMAAVCRRIVNPALLLLLIFRACKIRFCVRACVRFTQIYTSRNAKCVRLCVCLKMQNTDGVGWSISAECVRLAIASKRFMSHVCWVFCSISERLTLRYELEKRHELDGSKRGFIFFL